MNFQQSFIVASHTNSPKSHFCATFDISKFLTVHMEDIVLSPLQSATVSPYTYSAH